MRLVLIGGGGHARVVAEAAALAGWRVVGCVDLQPEPGLPALGADDALPGVLVAHDAQAILAVGGIQLRRRLASLHSGISWATIVHPRATVSPGARLGPGTFVGAGAVVNFGTEGGAHVVINTAAVIEHDCRLGNHVLIAPGAVLGGRVTIGESAVIGLGARVRDGVVVGAGAMVGMGAVAVAAVRPGATVLGVPARERT